MIILPMPINSKYAPDIPTICITIVYFTIKIGLEIKKNVQYQSTLTV